jgi:hypothetical protein
MKKILLAIVLAATAAAVAQTTSAPSQPAAAPQAAPPQTAPPQKKEIKDPAEYNAYVGAVQQQDTAAKISGLEAFLTQYPNSVMKVDALELLMGTYQQAASQTKDPAQQAASQAKAIGTAQKVLQADACNLRALALLAYTKRAMAEAGQAAQQNLTEAGQFGEKGVQCLQTAPKPDGMSDADFQKFKTQTAVIFNGSAGMSAFQAKDYGKAQQFLRASVEGDPANLRDIYPLALAYLTAGPAEKPLDGLFFIARAANLAQGAGKDQIGKFGRSKYVKYHGAEDGWNELLAQTATTTLPPSGFTIKQYVPPTPAEQCTDLLKTKKVEEMNFAEWQLCLSEGTPEDADKVWSILKGKPLQMVAQVITVTPTEITLAGSQDDIDKKTADINLTMSAKLTPKQTPKEASDLMFEGTPVSYTAKPFLITMKDGALVVKAPPKKPPVHRKPSQ